MAMATGSPRVTGQGLAMPRKRKLFLSPSVWGTSGEERLREAHLWAGAHSWTNCFSEWGLLLLPWLGSRTSLWSMGQPGAWDLYTHPNGGRHSFSLYGVEWEWLVPEDWKIWCCAGKYVYAIQYLCLLLSLH